MAAILPLRLASAAAGGRRVQGPRPRIAIAPQVCYPEAMQITVQLPDDLARHPNPAREALEAFAIEGFRSGALSAYQTRLLLDIETRYELDDFLKKHDVWDHAYSVQDLENDAAGFERQS